MKSKKKNKLLKKKKEKKLTNIISRSEKETYDLAFDMAKKAFGGEVITLTGELGAGKTVFSKGFAAGLGIQEEITSPTFTIMNEYAGEKFTLCHVDAYRLSCGEEAYAAGLCDYIGADGCVCLIEWAQNIKSVLPENTVKIEIKYVDENTREIIVL